MPQPEPAELERRLNAGEWLRPGEVAILLGASRASVDRWIRGGRIAYRRRGPTGHRELKPDDVRKELDEYRQERRNGTDTPSA